MARIRTVKPSFWSHPITGKLSDASKCMAIALLNLADDEGYFYADPVSVRSFCRPFDDDSVITRGTLQELSRVGYISISEHPERGPVGRVNAFSEHQRVDKATPSTIKTYFLQEHSTNAPRLFHAGREGKGKEGNVEERGDFNSTEAGMYVCHSLELSGREMQWLAKDAVEQAVKTQNLSPGPAAEFIVQKWNEYQQSDVKFKVSKKRFLQESVFNQEITGDVISEVLNRQDS